MSSSHCCTISRLHQVITPMPNHDQTITTVSVPQGVPPGDSWFITEAFEDVGFSSVILSFAESRMDSVALHFPSAHRFRKTCPFFTATANLVELKSVTWPLTFSHSHSRNLLVVAYLCGALSAVLIIREGAGCCHWTRDSDGPLSAGLRRTDKTV